MLNKNLFNIEMREEDRVENGGRLVRNCQDRSRLGQTQAGRVHPGLAGPGKDV